MEESMNWFEKYFSLQVFFLIFRETIETAVIVSVLLAFINQSFGTKLVQTERRLENQEAIPEEDVPDIESDSRKIYRQLVIQVWAGAVCGLLICLAVGMFFVYAFYKLGTNLWGATEKLWEAIFSIIASVIITIMGAKMLRINKMREKWRVKIAQSIINTRKSQVRNRRESRFTERYTLAILPFVTTLREGLEAVVFLGGIGVNQPKTSFPLPVITALILGGFIGWVMYRTGDHMSIHYFLVASTCFLYIVAAGLMSRGVWFFELQQFINKVGQDVSEMGSGPGSYDITTAVWHVNCCNAQTDGPWMIFNALLGWQNTATYGSVISYNLYWWVLMAGFWCVKQREQTGYWPLIPKGRFNKYKSFKFNAPDESLFEEARHIYTSENADDQVTLLNQNRSSQDSLTPLVR